MNALPPPATQTPTPAFHATALQAELRVTVPESMPARAPALLAPPPELTLAGTGVILLDLASAFAWGEAQLATLCSPGERAEIGAAGGVKRRREKIAGKVATKLLAREALWRWFGLDAPLDCIEVASPAMPVRVTASANVVVHAVLRALAFSISHSDDVVGAAVSRLAVGLDVEKIVSLSPGVVAMIEPSMRPGDSPTEGAEPAGQATADPAPIVTFTRKEAVLKAAGVGLSDGLDSVALPPPRMGIAQTVEWRSRRFHVVSAILGGSAYSLAIASDVD